MLVGVQSSARGSQGPDVGWEGPSGPPDWKGLCLPHSLLLEHLLRSWERIPKKVRSWKDNGRLSLVWVLGSYPQPLSPFPEKAFC